MEHKLKLVVRVTTSKYITGNAIVSKKELRVLKRKSNCGIGNMFNEAEEIDLIINLDSVEDGVYEVQTCNHSYWYGQLDDYDFVLVPYTEYNNSNKVPEAVDCVKLSGNKLLIGEAK